MDRRTLRRQRESVRAHAVCSSTTTCSQQFQAATTNLHMRRPQFQQPRGQHAPFTASQTNSYASPPLVGTFANPLPLTYEQQHSLPQQSNRSSRNVHAVESAGHDAPQVLAAVKLNGVKIEGALIYSSSSFSFIASSTLSALLERYSVEQFMHRPQTLSALVARLPKFWATSTSR